MWWILLSNFETSDRITQKVITHLYQHIFNLNCWTNFKYTCKYRIYYWFYIVAIVVIAEQYSKITFDHFRTLNIHEAISRPQFNLVLSGHRVKLIETSFDSIWWSVKMCNSIKNKAIKFKMCSKIVKRFKWFVRRSVIANRVIRIANWVGGF